MQHENFDEVSLDETFGEGPQIDLGDITDLLKDASIVDLSWLKEPVTFQHDNSIVPGNKDLEHNWGDTTDNLYGAFKLVKGNPSVREQIKKKSLWDHSEEMQNNVYHWTSPSVSKSATKKRSAQSSLQFLKRLIHRGYTGENLNLEARKYMPQDEWEKAASVRSLVGKEEGVLGNVYVDVTAFDTCYKAKEVTDKYNKTAKFVIETSACGGCSYNTLGKCSLVSKKIAKREDIFTDANVKAYTDYLSSLKRIPEDFLKRNASISNQEKLQAAFLNKKNATVRNGGVKAKLPSPTSSKTFNAEPFIRVASKYLAKGYDVSYLRSKIASKVPNREVDAIIKKAASSADAVPANVASCNSDILKEAKLLRRSAKCSGCSYDMSSHCGVSKTAFTSPKEVSQRKVSATFASLPMASSAEQNSSLVKKATKALESGHSFNRVHDAVSKIIGTSGARKALDEALVQSRELSASQFDSCEEPAFKLAASIKKSAKCNDCSYNKGLSCGLTKKAFVSKDKFDSSTVADHQLYGSFYKDLTLDRMVSVNEKTSHEALEIEGLNQFNL